MGSWVDSVIVPAAPISASLPDQHEDDACCDVQTADGTGDAYLHIETLHGSAHCSSACLAVWRWRTGDGQVAQWDEENLFFYHFIFSASCCNAVKNIQFSFSGFILNYIVIMALQCEYSVCSTVREFLVLKRSSFKVMIIFLWRDKLVHLFFI